MPEYELLRFRTRDGGDTTVYLTRHPAASTRVSVLHFREPTRLDHWCAANRRPEAIVAGFFVRDPYRPLGEVRLQGSAVEHEPVAAPWRGRRACVHVDGAVRLASLEEIEGAGGDLVQAGPLLVRDGQSLIDGSDPEGFSAGSGQFDSDITVGRYPRCALGVSDDELLAVCCDGRRSGVDAGLELGELARLLISFGAREAINLDGGGSSTLVHGGHLLNRPYSNVDQPAPESRPIVTALVLDSGMSRVLVVLASVLALAATLTAYAWRVLYDSGQFANRATATLEDPRTRAVIGDRVTDELIVPRRSELLAARPFVSSVVAGVVGTDAFASLFRRSVRDVHGGVFRGDEDTVTLTLTDVGIVVAAALRALDPELAASIESDERVVVLQSDFGSVTGDVLRVGRRLRAISLLLAGLTLAAMVGALALSGDRRRTASQLGAGFAAVGIAIVAADTIAQALVLASVDEPDVWAAAWDAFLGDLRTAGWVIAGAGAVVAAAAASVVRPVTLEQRARVAWRYVIAEPESTPLRVVRAVALVAAGVFTVAAPAAVLVIVTTLIGVYLIYKGLELLLRVTYRPGEERARPRLRRLVVSLVAALVIATALAAFVTGGGVDEPAPVVSGCNGRTALCSKPLTDIALAATHNSMSAPEPGWFASLQERPIAGQLEDGIRGLLLDTHYADRLPNGRTRTYFTSAEDLARTASQDGVSPESVAAAQRLRARAGFRGEGERGMYLCHTFCELGATPLDSVLDDIHEFLVSNPADVLVIVNQDYVTPEDFVAAIGAAGLDRYVFTPPSDGDWPTLREMIDSDQRLMVLAENRAGAAPWYQLAYERLLQETPFTFKQVDRLTGDLAATCVPNRGTDTAPLFLINHWINTDPLPRPALAEVVNAFEPLLRRAETCRRIRGQLPNLLAVDFYERGDVFAVVDALNGISVTR